MMGIFYLILYSFVISVNSVYLNCSLLRFTNTMSSALYQCAFPATNNPSFLRWVCCLSNMKISLKTFILCTTTVKTSTSHFLLGFLQFLIMCFVSCRQMLWWNLYLYSFFKDQREHKQNDNLKIVFSDD